MRWTLRRRGRAPRPGRARRGPWRSFLGAFWPFILGSLLVAGGLAAIVLGYVGVAGTVHVGLQLPYLVSGALLGLALVGIGSALLVMQAMARQARLLRRLLEETRVARAGTPPAPGGSDGAPDGMVVVVSGARRFHRPDCLLVQGKQVRRLKPTTARRRGLSACDVCDPHAPEGAEEARPTR